MVQAAANKLIKRLLRYSRLSKNGLKEVDIDMQTFLEDITRYSRCWEATRISMVFNILSQSSSTLKKLRLQLGGLAAELAPLAYRVSHLTSIIQNLDSRSFPNLKEVVIAFDVLIGLKSESGLDGRMIEIQEPRLADYLRLGEDISMEEEKSMFNPLIDQVKAFTEVGIETLSCLNTPNFGLEMVRRLEESKESLKQIFVRVNRSNRGQVALLHFALSCPNLEDLTIQGYGRHESGASPVEIKVPKGQDYVSKMRRFRLRSSNCMTLLLDEAFIKWVSGAGLLEHFDLDASRFEESVSIDFKLLRPFISSSQSLVYLRIQELELPSTTSSQLQVHPQLQLPNLQQIVIEGDANLINFFTSIQYACLRNLNLLCTGAIADEVIDHSQILKVFKSSKTSLESIEIYDINSHLHLLQDRDGIFKDVFSLPKLTEINLTLSDDYISDFYLSIDYPKLEKLKLPKSSKISRTSFSRHFNHVAD